MSNVSVLQVVSCNCHQHFTSGSLYTSDPYIFFYVSEPLNFHKRPKRYFETCHTGIKILVQSKLMVIALSNGLKMMPRIS